ncbi:asparaginase [Nocardioides sp. HDW12B]|uniref:asparaginase n=1 Tax=Nocardioides sp. HDW12B TaxID=2714939 RepID=UPI00140792EE|nr:asparaginase [Nocardioides sp. HDW12B]QIK65969.1 asparaginase [Nocardioides sp. HDW12B]
MSDLSPSSVPSAPSSPDHVAGSGAVVVAEVVRSAVVEGRHHGRAVALDAAGDVTWSLGAPDAVLLPRSCVKPLQALALVRHGLDLPDDLLAIACASHSGEPVHLDAVRRVLAGAGLSEADLHTPEDWPFDPEERDRVVRAGGTRTRIAMNCSGKHAAMLATCVVNGWPTATYLDPEHPVQVAVRSTLEELTGVPVEATLVDGCGAPLMSTTLTGLARAFARLATAADGPEQRVADAIRRHPTLVSGTRRDEAALLSALPGAIGKVGAEACYAVALPDGRAVALKIEDGGDRARPVVMAAALERLGVLDDPGVDSEAVRATGRHVLRGGGHPVGEVRAAF